MLVPTVAAAASAAHNFFMVSSQFRYYLSLKPSTGLVFVIEQPKVILPGLLAVLPAIGSPSW